MTKAPQPANDTLRLDVDRDVPMPKVQRCKAVSWAKQSPIALKGYRQSVRRFKIDGVDWFAANDLMRNTGCGVGGDSLNINQFIRPVEAAHKLLIRRENGEDNDTRRWTRLIVLNAAGVAKALRSSMVAGARGLWLAAAEEMGGEILASDCEDIPILTGSFVSIPEFGAELRVYALRGQVLFVAEEVANAFGYLPGTKGKRAYKFVKSLAPKGRATLHPHIANETRRGSGVWLIDRHGALAALRKARGPRAHTFHAAFQAATEDINVSGYVDEVVSGFRAMIESISA